MHSNLLLAEDILQEASPISNSALQAPETASDQESNNITWPLLSGESVQSLAKLFYPKNKRMQRLFIRKTLQLSQEIRPNLNAYTTTNQASLIIIPHIKTLAKHSGKIKSARPKKASVSKQPKLHMSYGLKDAEKYALSPQMQADYEALVKKNEQLKQDLDKLNAKLAHLQQVMVALNDEIKRTPIAPVTTSTPIAEVPVPTQAPAAVEPPKPAESLEQTQSSAIQTPAIKEADVKEINAQASNPQAANVLESVKSAAPEAKPGETNITVEPSASVKPPVAQSPAPKPAVVRLAVEDTAQESIIAKYLLEIITLLIVLAIALVIFLYRRKQAKTFRYFSSDSLQPMDKSEFVSTFEPEEDKKSSVDVVELTQTPSEFSASAMEGDLNTLMAMKNKEEGDMVLEQAKIYVNINREREAIMLLKSQIQAAPKASLPHWLALLNVYRKTNQKAEFMDYARQLHQTFNVMLPTWDSGPLPMVVATSLEEFPHIIEQVIKLWADCDAGEDQLKAAKSYLNTLLTDNRDSERAGFGLDVIQEIMLLRDLLDVRERLAREE